MSDAPSFSNENPSTNTYNQSINPTVNITISDRNGNSTTCDWYTSTDGISFTHRQTNSSVTANTSISYTWTTATEYQTIYYWKVTANDGVYNSTSNIYNFETTPYHTSFFNDTYPNENWINSSNNMIHEAGWENFSFSPSPTERDGFEDQDLSDWTFAGDADWIITTDEKYEGSYSASSGDIPDGDNSEMYKTFRFSEDVTFSFYWKVGSENNYDKLKWYVDSNIQNTISGATAWAEQTYGMSADTDYVIKFRYDKDVSATTAQTVVI